MARSRDRRAATRSPVFGGRTANAEFEALTGLSTRFLPPGSIPYQQYVKRPMESVASVFRDQGYRTVAVHNFRRRFWNRDRVYPNLGFDEYVSLEDLQEVPLEFGWPSDAAVFDRVERILAETDRPTFVFAVTVATHGPYVGGGLRPTVSLVNPPRPDLVEPMSVYASKLALLDRHFGDFVTRIELLTAPPIVVAFGDHLPSVAAGALEPDSASGLPRSRMVEALILGGAQGVTEAEPRSLNCLGPEILRLADIQPPPFFRFVENLCLEKPVVTPLRTAIDDDATLDGYRWLSYDRLFGAGYS
ncbi:MAG: LTA synthase family protein, partial [Candidatus Binatia bacterium]